MDQETDWYDFMGRYPPPPSYVTVHGELYPAQLSTQNSPVQNQTFFIFEIHIFIPLQARYSSKNKHFDTKNNKIDPEEAEMCMSCLSH